MRTFLRSFFGALALAAVIIIGATAVGTSDASARSLGSHMHGHSHGHHMHGHHFRHSFRHMHSHRYHYSHYRHWHGHYRHYRYSHYRHYRHYRHYYYRHWHWWHRYHTWSYDHPDYSYSYRYGRPGYGGGEESGPPARESRPAEPCNCLTKRYLPDGSVLFRDRCTEEEAIAPAGRR